ncbi:hypothetical protein [Senegalia massiliensis]|uniref:Uncharacterized protein n=1 Tax=Senegalia massiliensis TaxID=1720316 RepID=A0A845R199_9CLOT|nr:hypothetical protein [Senegalia massiliensis]NBI08200.1 hypothetical protein [Senegalia massiliensis]
MKKMILNALLGGLSVLVFIIIFTNIFGVDPSTFYKGLIEGTIVEKYYLDLIFFIFIVLALILKVRCID